MAEPFPANRALWQWRASAVWGERERPERGLWQLQLLQKSVADAAVIWHVRRREEAEHWCCCFGRGLLIGLLTFLPCSWVCISHFECCLQARKVKAFGGNLSWKCLL